LEGAKPSCQILTGIIVTNRERLWMRVCLAAIGVVALVGSSAAALAGCPGGSCDQPVVVYPPAPGIVAPAGYVLDPSDARRDFYIVNQGPVYDGPDITWFPAPTYSEGGYAIARPYPYIHPHYGRRYRRRWSDRSNTERSGDPAFDAYGRDTAPSARIIEIAPSYF
jgi:hypothetical protein